jgi:hypothetical protein
MMTDIRELILSRLADGESLSTICKSEGMPNRSTVQRWQADDAEFDAAVTRAREDGYHLRAEQAVLSAKTAEDASRGRLAFDAERWYLGKLSNAFSDNKAQKHEVALDLSDKAKLWLGLTS